MKIASSTPIGPEVWRSLILAIRIAIRLADSARSLASINGIQLAFEQLALKPDLSALFAIPPMVDSIAKVTESTYVQITIW